MKTLQNKSHRGRNILSVALLAAGALLISVPLIMTYFNMKRNDDIIEEFMRQSEQAVSASENLHEEEVESFYIPSELTSEAAASPEAEAGADENAELSLEEIEGGTASNKKPLMSKEEIQKRMTGVLIIPKIDVKMVIMDGVDEETLRVAAGRLPNTGNLDEIGNCVLAGHRSYTFGKYLNRLDELEVGDEIKVQTKTKTLKYIIYKKHIVEPNDFSITKSNGKDKVLTVFTCHPVAIASHRLVVHAKQVE